MHDTVILTAANLPAAEQALAAADKTMAKLIATHPPCRLARRQSPFHVLATSIINQQLSQKAADAIEARLAALAPSPFVAADIARLKPEVLRSAGLSGGKVRYLKNLAAADAAGVLAEKELRRMPDEAVIERLTAISGVGKWTAEMFLMFGLRRADIVSLGDAGLRRAARQLYDKRYRAADDETVLAKAAMRWSPWRTVACWHLWRSLD